jgi:hypothetical protein
MAGGGQEGRGGRGVGGEGRGKGREAREGQGSLYHKIYLILPKPLFLHINVILLVPLWAQITKNVEPRARLPNCYSYPGPDQTDNRVYLDRQNQP